jgi:uncharacterized membrane protein YphA (DoxX/SURF4 family)
MHPINTFPQLLDYAINAPAILRITAAVAFVYIAQFFLRERLQLLAIENIPLVSRMRPWMVWASSIAAIIIALFLFVGLYTQWAALIGALIILKHLYATKHYSSYLPFSRGTYLLLLIILLSLLLTGAGQPAFDRFL